MMKFSCLVFFLVMIAISSAAIFEPAKEIQMDDQQSAEKSKIDLESDDDLQSAETKIKVVAFPSPVIVGQPFYRPYSSGFYGYSSYSAYPAVGYPSYGAYPGVGYPSYGAYPSYPYGQNSKGKGHFKG